MPLNFLKPSDLANLERRFKGELKGSPQEACVLPWAAAMDRFNALSDEEIALELIDAVLGAVKKLKDCTGKNKDFESKTTVAEMVKDADKFYDEYKKLIDKRAGVLVKDEWKSMRESIFKDSPADCLAKIDRATSIFHAVAPAKITPAKVDVLKTAFNGFRQCLIQRKDPKAELAEIINGLKKTCEDYVKLVRQWRS